MLKQESFKLERMDFKSSRFTALKIKNLPVWELLFSHAGQLNSRDLLYNIVPKLNNAVLYT